MGYIGRPARSKKGGRVVIESQTAAASATLDFIDGTGGVVMDDTYPIYEVHLINMHPATDSVNPLFQVNASGGSGFNETITSAAARQYIAENNTGENFNYDTFDDQAQGTAYQQILGTSIGNANDESASGILTLFQPTSTSYVKHFMSQGVGLHEDAWVMASWVGGYINTQSVIDEISFKFSSGNIDSGTIHMYGVKNG